MRAGHARSSSGQTSSSSARCSWRAAPRSTTRPSRLGQQVELGPRALRQLRVGEAQLDGEVGNETGVSGVGLVAGQIVELPAHRHDEALDEDVTDTDRVEATGDDLPEMARRLHCHDELAETVPLAQLGRSSHQPLHARPIGRDCQPAQAPPVGGPAEDHDALLLGQVDASDQGVDGQPRTAPGKLHRLTAHPTSNLHGGCLSGVRMFDNHHASRTGSLAVSAPVRS